MTQSNSFDHVNPRDIVEHMNIISDNLTIKKSSEILQELEKFKIDVTKELPKPQICLFYRNGLENQVLGVLGDFMVITGKAKSKKSFALGLMVAASISKNNIGNISGNLPNEKRNILYFDTEMAEYSVQLAAKRIIKLAECDNPSNFEIYTLRQLDHSIMFEMIEAKLYDTPNLGFVIIDGIRDLTSSINDEAEATRLSRALLRWTQELNIFIVCVLHQNKNDNSVRGHLGTELINKAMTVLSVTKDQFDQDISVVSPEFCRFAEPEPFAFRINEDGLPEFVDLPEKQSGRTTIKLSSFTDDQHKERIKGIFSEYEKPNGNIMRMRIKEMFSIGDTKAREFLQIYESKGWIEFIGKKGAKDSYYSVAQA